MAIDAVSRFIVKADRVVDYVPFLSILNNAAILIAKIALSIFSRCFPSMYEKIQDNALIDHIANQKSVWECIGVAIPFLNILVALCRDFPGPVRAALQPQPSAVEQVMDEAMRKVEESNAQLIQEDRKRQAEAKQKLDANRAEQEKKHRENLAEYDRKISACPDTEKGRILRDRLILGKQTSEGNFASYQSASDSLRQANGL